MFLATGNSEQPRPPLVVIGGFLGAGKTTFINQLLTTTLTPPRPFLIFNDFGVTAFDQALLAGTAGIMRSIQGSCVCCSSFEDFLQNLREAARVDAGWVVVETNGTAVAMDLISALLSGERHQPSAPIWNVCLVDAMRWQKRFWHNTLERELFEASTHWHLSKLDCVSAPRAALVRRSLNQLAPGAREVTPKTLAAEVMHHFNHSSPTPRPSPRITQIHPDSHAFQVLQIPLTQPYDRPSLINWVRQLPPEVIRVKGVVHLSDHPTPHAIQRTEGRAISSTTSEAVDALALVRFN